MPRVAIVALALLAALALAQPAAARAQQPEASLIARADRALAAGRYDDAATAYLDVLTAGDRALLPAAWLGLARTAAARGDARAAQLHATMLLRHRPAESSTAQYVLALAARDAGDTRDLDASALAFRTVEAAGGVLAPVAHLRLAQALAAASRDVEAAAAFRVAAARPELPDILRIVALLEGASSLQRLARPDDALALLDTPIHDPASTAFDIASARWLAATIRRELDDSGWLADAAAVVAAAPAATEATLALDALIDAAAEVDALQAAYVRYLARDDERARDRYRAVADAPADAASASVAWFYLGAIAERAPERDDAIAAYGRSLDFAPFGWLADDALWWRALLLEENGRHVEAASAFEALVRDFPASPFAPGAALRGPLARARAGDTAAAVDALRRLTETRTGDIAARAARWLAVLGGGAPPPPSTFDPTSIATLLDGAGDAATAPLPAFALTEWSAPAVDRAEIERWLVDVFGPPPADAIAPLDDPRYELAIALTAVDESAVARQLLRGLIRDATNNPHGLAALALAASEAGLPDVALNAATALLSGFSPGDRLHTPLSLEQLAYPAPYADEVLAAARAEQIPPLLLLALVRQESAFNPRAGSHAGARGLTQVIDPTGREIAASLGVPWDPADLLRPVSSLRFGAHYLARQLREFDGNMLAALAAYNGGPANARRWVKSQWWPGADGYVHAIDFAETRAYVERVLENYAWYRYLYAAAPLPALP